MWQDLALNLVSEAAGILVTVAIVDRLIKRSEARRWTRVYNVLLARVFRGVDRLLYATHILRGGDTKFFHFGDSSVLGHEAGTPLDLVDVEKTLSSSVTVVDELRRESDNPLNEADRILATFEESPSATQEPEILAMVAELRDQITMCIEFRDGKAKDEDFLSTVGTVVHVALRLRKTLERHVSRVETLDDFIKILEARSAA